MQKTLLTLLVCCATMGCLWGQDLDWVQTQNALVSNNIDVAVDQDGNSYLAGTFEGSMDLDPGPGTFLVASPFGVLSAYIQKLDSNQQFLWGAEIEGSMAASILELQFASNGDLLVLGSIQGTGDLDPGVGVHAVNHGASAYFLIRLDELGNYKWATSLDIPGYSFADIAPDTSGGFYFGFATNSTVDIDFGPGVANVSSMSGNDAVIARYDSTSALDWHYEFTGINDQTVLQMAAVQGNVYFLGAFSDTVDVDPSPAVANLIFPTLHQNPVLISYTQIGNLRWAGDFPTRMNNYWEFAAAPNGNVTLVGSYMDSVDIDMGPGSNVHFVSNQGFIGSFALQVNSSGNPIWSAFWESSSFVEPMSIAMGAQGDCYIGFQFSDSVDFDHGPGVYDFYSPQNIYGAAVTKIDPSGNFVWAGQLAGSGEAIINGLASNGNILLLSGAFQGTIDFAPTAADTHNVNATVETGFLAAWRQNPCTSLLARIDSVTNVACGSVPGTILAHATGGLAPYSYLWNTTPASNTALASSISSGNFLLTVTDSLGCVASRGVHLGGPSIQSGFDLQSNLIGGPFRPGLPAVITVDAFNEGCIPIGGQIKVILDSLVSFGSSTPLADSVVGDTVYYTFAPMAYGDPHFVATLTLITALSANIGDSIHLGVIITPVNNDVQPVNNIRLDYAFPVINGFDPNDITAYPPGACDEHYTLRSQPLTYTVRFQNTGNAEAIRVMVEDSLPASLDLATLTIKGSSHAMITEVMPGNVLNFVFDNIHLADSASNEPASHGWLVYEVMPVAGVPVGTVVENKVGIFFDFNPAVVTNTASNTLVDVIPACTPLGAAAGAAAEFSVYPNPTRGLLHLRHTGQLQAVLVTDLLGHVVYDWRGSAQALDLDTEAWTPGCYIVRAATRKGVEAMKVVVE